MERKVKGGIMVGSLNDKLTELAETIVKKLPEDFALANQKAVKDLTDSKSILGLKEGDVAPRFILPNATGVSVSLDKLLERGPVVLSFYRGSW